MVESTRVGRAGAVEVHLKKKLEITSEIVADVAQLPSSEPWYVLLRITNTGSWTLVGSFGDFEPADQRFAQASRNRGLADAGRLELPPPEPGHGREIPP